MKRKLLEQGCDPKGKTVFTLGGVLPYLNEEAADSLFRFIVSTSGRGSSVVFTDFNFTRLQELASRDERVQGFFAEVARLGEPIKFGLGPDRMQPYLNERGYGEITPSSVKEIKRGFGKHAHDMDPLYFVVTARVSGG